MKNHAMTILTGQLQDPQIQALLKDHLAGMYDTSPPENVFALDTSGLATPDVTLYSAWQDDTLLGMGALKDIGSRTGEIKSMRTHADHLRKGVGAILLEHIIAEASKRGWQRLSLETGSGAAFEPALQLYQRYGFTMGAPFADYESSQFSQFYHLDL